jgi:hypothetical protein
LDQTPKAWATKAKLDKWGLSIKAKTLLHSKGNNKQNAETADMMGENIYHLFIR